MQDVDAAHDRQLPDGRNSTIASSADAPRWPNAAAVLEMLAALETEFKSVLEPPAPASE
jgi:hypothetical protein